MEANSFGMRLKKFREDVLDISQKKLAELLDVESQNAVSGYERNERSPDVDQFKKLFDLGCDLNWLIGGKEIPEREEIVNLRQRFLATEKDRDNVRKEILGALARCESKLAAKKTES
jgi:transcriptional regulator with XRE-family HTH domain